MGLERTRHRRMAVRLRQILCRKSRGRRRSPEGNDGSTCDTLIARLEMATYVCIADFEYKISRSGQSYGWGVARYCTPEAMYGSGIAHCDRTPQESRDRILSHLASLFPNAAPAHLQRMI